MKYRFKITYESLSWKEANNLMRKFDLGIEAHCVQETYELITNRDYEETAKIKKALIESYAKLGINVYDIIGGVWE